MTYQTKYQSLGYVLKALIDSGSYTKELKQVHYKIKENMDIEDNEGEYLDNYSTYDNMIFSMRELGASDKRIKEVGSYLYNAYDFYTTEEAEDFYNAFLVILEL